MEYRLIDINPGDTIMNAKFERLLAQSGLRRDARLDYTAGVIDEDYRLLATGSCAGNTLRCIAVDDACRGEGLLNSVVSRLTEVQAQRGNSHIFVYTKVSSSTFFHSLGYRTIAEVDGKLAFMENKTRGFEEYLNCLGPARSEASCAIVMNANPFTFGHQHLVRQAAAEGFVHVFVVAEDVSEFSFEARYQMVKEGCAQWDNVFVHSTGPYMISEATFPAYFLSDNEEVTYVQARLDAEIFSKIAARLNIKKRFFGQEPLSKTTDIYNQCMLQTLPPKGVEVVILPRLEIQGRVVSASQVRSALRTGDMDIVKEFLPPSTYTYAKKTLIEGKRQM